MTSTSFQFKQFIIHQGQCAMKVSTDACILGAWIARSHAADSVLDMGTGTGLLSLMLAQAMPHAQIDAVEIEALAAQQARENIRLSPWSDRLQVIEADIVDYAQQCHKIYDMIVSNPPFFTASLKSGDRAKNLAKHDMGNFNKENLLLSIQKLLSPTGTAFVLFPAEEAAQLMLKAEAMDLNPSVALTVRNQEEGKIFRQIVALSQQALPRQEASQLIIRKGNAYTSAFEDLMRPYYLKL